MDYVVFSSIRAGTTSRIYTLCRVTDRLGKGEFHNVIGRYPTKKAAMTVARLLAGWSGRVEYRQI